LQLKKQEYKPIRYKLNVSLCIEPAYCYEIYEYRLLLTLINSYISEFIIGELSEVSLVSSPVKVTKIFIFRASFSGKLFREYSILCFELFLLLMVALRRTSRKSFTRHSQDWVSSVVFWIQERNCLVSDAAVYILRFLFQTRNTEFPCHVTISLSTWEATPH
jgi:hypothetical protein